MKRYQVFFVIKKFKNEFVYHVFETARNKKEAVYMARQYAKEKYGRTAFYTTAFGTDGDTPDGPDCEITPAFLKYGYEPKKARKDW